MKNYIFTAVLLFLTISLSAQPIPKYKDALFDVGCFRQLFYDLLCLPQSLGKSRFMAGFHHLPFIEGNRADLHRKRNSEESDIKVIAQL